MASKVYFINTRAAYHKNQFAKFKELLGSAGLPNLIEKNDLVAVKVHFGEMGNSRFLRPIWARELVRILQLKGAKPFLTDTNTLYKGSRSHAVDHLLTATSNGFGFSTVFAPIIIADGLRGTSGVEVRIDKKHFKEIEVAEAAYRADSLVVLTHFKGHGVTGFGGTIKNVGMGLTTKSGKSKLHTNAGPVIDEELCTGCGLCAKWCGAEAIKVIDEKAKIDRERCTGCGQCLVSCPNNATRIDWSSVPSKIVQERICEAALAVIKDKEKKFFLNFLVDITPDCDCCPHSDASIVPDIGILASLDPVAIDQAGVDLVNASYGLKDTALKRNFAKGEDKFKAIHPNVNWEIQLSYAEKIGLGSRKYELIAI
ncbi:DUF362 domain-containing protein [bacterium]|nr:DUF362 domain-containing protein [bacterium]MBU1613777.1 DUF362 domain-containing protein [bacterium]